MSILRQLLASHPYAATVDKQFDQYFANVKPEDRPPPTVVPLHDPADPMRKLSDDEE